MAFAETYRWRAHWRLCRLGDKSRNWRPLQVMRDHKTKGSVIGEWSILTHRHGYFLRGCRSIFSS